MTYNPERQSTQPAMRRGESKRSENFDSLMDKDAESMHDLGIKFDNAGQAGDKMVQKKFDYVGKRTFKETKTPLMVKGG